VRKTELYQIKEESYNEGYKRGYDDYRSRMWFWIETILLIIICISVVASGFISDQITEKKVEIDSKVYSVQMHGILYATVVFTNGQTYNINIPTASNGVSTLDLDNGEHVLIKLRWSSVWFDSNSNDCWGVESIVKY